jgi:diguanylate cyclase (GGDEF)-like protein
MSTSIGISIYPNDSEEINTLLSYADIAMYHAKKAGRNTYQFYDPKSEL